MGVDAPFRQLVAWQPGSAPQRALLACPAFEVFFGGARGGGKTDGILGEWAQHSGGYGEDAIGLMVRRSRVQLTETFERAKVIYRPLGATFTDTPMRVVMPNGARLIFAYLDATPTRSLTKGTATPGFTSRRRATSLRLRLS